MKALFVSLALAGLMLPAAQAGTLTFDDISNAEVVFTDGGVHHEQGVDITLRSTTPDSLFFAGLDGSGAYAGNGTPNLYAANGAGLVFTLGGGGLFDLSSLELGGGNLLGDRSEWAGLVSLLGLDADNQVLSVDVNLSLANDGLQLVNLGWMRLSRFELRVASGDYSLDNLQFNAAPEPGSAALVLAALLGLAVLAARRRRG